MGIAPHAGAGGLTNTKLALANAVESDVMSGKKFYAKNKELKTGTMHNNGRWPEAEKFTLEGDRIWMYQKQDGYLEGGLGISAYILGNAQAEHVLSGVSASSSYGIGFSGTMTNIGYWTNTIEPGKRVYIPKGYHNGSGWVEARAVNNNDVIGKIKRASTTSRYVSNSSIYILGLDNIAAANNVSFPYQQFYISEDHHTATWATAPGAAWTYLYLDV